jgi:hypothetical protein
MDIRYSYLGYSLIFLVLWLIFYLLRPDLRKRMLIFSLIITPLGPVSELWFLRDYWRRDTITGYPIGVEDAFFSFAIAGIAYSFYKLVFHLTAVQKQDSARHDWLILAFLMMTILPLLLLTDVFHINSIFSSALSFLGIAVLTWVLRPDLWKPSVIGGVLIVILFFLVYKAMQILFPGAIEYWCTGCNPSGVRISGVNLEELLWDFAWGLAGSPMVEVIRGEKFVKWSRTVHQ